MSMTFLNQLGVIPALLITLTGLVMLRGQNGEKAARRFLLYLLGVGVLLLLVLFITMRFITEPYEQPFFQLSNLLAPSVLGISALIMLDVKELAHTDRKIKITAASLALGMVILFGLLWSSQLGVGYLVLPGALFLALVWALGRRYGRLATALGLLSLVGLFLNNWLMSNPLDYTGGSPSVVLGIVYLLGFNIWPFLAVVLSAVLMTASFRHMSVQGENAAPRRSRLVRLFAFGLASMLLLYLAYTIFWGSVWDHTNDGLFGVLVSSLAGLIAVGAGMAMTVTLEGKYRLAGLLFILVVPIMLYQSFEAGWRVSYHEITEKRAARIVQALDRFQAREGYYPESLDKLIPRDLLFIQQPVILAGEEWCYQGGEAYYRLGAFYREYFSLPVSLRMYASAGEPPARPWECEQRLAEMKEKYYSPVEDPAAMRPHLPTPLPDIQVGIPKTEIQPVLEGAVAFPGSWSPDSAYFVFGAQTANLTLHFLNGKTGQICAADGQFATVDRLRERHAWLPDGRLLFVDSSSEIVVLMPCQPEIERLTDRFPETFTQIETYAPENGQIILKSAAAYWILDGDTLTAQPIPGVTPNPYQAHGDTFAWLPGGERLVINRLNGRSGSKEGSTLYLINGATEQVEKSLTLEGDFGQSAPWIEGLSEQELLVHGTGELLVIDFSSDPPKVTNVLADIFGLDIKYPDEVSAAGSFIDREGGGYYLAVCLNHPRNQATYLYYSQTGQVHVYDHEHHTLLLFPNGYLMEMAKQENVPTYRDEYDLVLVDTPEAVKPRLVLTGHTPREYPHLSLVYLAKRSQLAVASAHGVSLVSLPDGEMEKYWTLVGDGFSPWIIASPDDSALVAAKDFGGLYYIPLPPGE